MINHSPRRLLSIDCKRAMVRRYEDRWRTDTVDLVMAGGVGDNTRRELEAFRLYGLSGIPYAPEPQIA